VVGDTVDGKNPANQLRLVVYQFIPSFARFGTSAGFLPSTVCAAENENCTMQSGLAAPKAS